MIEKTSNPNVLRVICPLPNWANMDPQTYRASVVALVELTSDSLKIWYDGNVYEQRPRSGSGPWSIVMGQSVTLSEAVKGMVSGLVMHEFWKAYANPNVEAVEDASDEVQQIAKTMREVAKKKS